MPYFAVYFGLDSGYAHVIENAEAFPEHFAKVSFISYISFNSNFNWL